MYQLKAGSPQSGALQPLAQTWQTSKLWRDQETSAISAWGLTATLGRGRIMAKPAFRIPYAAKTPNAIEAIDAQMSIARLSKFAIQSALINWDAPAPHGHSSGRPSNHNDAIVAENAAALTLFSVYQ